MEPHSFCTSQYHLVVRQFLLSRYKPLSSVLDELALDLYRQYVRAQLGGSARAILTQQKLYDEHVLKQLKKCYITATPTLLRQLEYCAEYLISRQVSIPQKESVLLEEDALELAAA